MLPPTDFESASSANSDKPALATFVILTHAPFSVNYLSSPVILRATTTNLPSSVCEAHVESVMSSSPYSAVTPLSYDVFDLTKSIYSSNSALSAALKNS